VRSGRLRAEAGSICHCTLLAKRLMVYFALATPIPPKPQGSGDVTPARCATCPLSGVRIMASTATPSTSNVSIKPVTTVTSSAARQRISMSEYADKLAMRLALPVGVLVFLLILLLNWQRPMVPFLGDLRNFGIIAAYGAVFGTLIMAGVGYTLGTLEHNRRTPDSHDRSWWWGIVPVAVTYGVMAAVLAVIVLQGVDAAFRGLELSRIQAALISAGVVGATVYTLSKQAIRLDAERLIRTAIIIIAAGVYLTAVSIEDDQWWRVSFSYLGSWDSTAHRIFNVTLIFGGVLLVVWTTLFRRDLETLQRHGYASERWTFWFVVGLYWVAVALAFVGLFKTRDGIFHSLMHNLSAYSLAAVLGAMMVGLRWAIPRIGAEFLALTWLFAGGLAVTLVMAALGTINTVGLEMISFALGILWLQSFVVTVHNIAQRLEPESYPT
jgi:uncharacterized membrane protein YidH (DUF202 family)